jgi:pSer/pThr/pTyr-binding forkhead associated (FHA) protein
MPFIVYNDRGMQKTFELPEDKMIVFGREDHVEFQIIKDSQVSREHFAIKKEDNGKFILIDLGASNGTQINGKLIEPNSITELKHRDEIKAGRQVFIYRLRPLSEKNTTQVVQGVMKEMKKGKSYHTIMCEILGKDKSK